MTALATLQTSLAKVNARFDTRTFGDPKGMAQAAAEIERSFGQGRIPDPDLVVRTLRAFLQTGTLRGYREIRNACHGFLVPVQGKRSIGTDATSAQLLLDHTDAFRKEPKKLKRCFQALLGAYFTLDGYDPGSASHEQWQALRRNLAAWLPTLHGINPRPEWLQAIIDHKNLLGSDPTQRYGSALLSGDRTEFEKVCASLAIGETSWVRRRAVMSVLMAAAAERDSAYRAYLASVLDLLKASPAVIGEGTALLLNRYAKLGSTPEHMPLRMMAIEAFGNPLIKANGGRWSIVSAEAREMVSNWLKEFLIERFFELLSHDGTTDKRRPKFWMRHRTSIENMWFVLGSSAYGNWNADFKELRATMGNQCLFLEGATSGNNAFVMKLGGIYVVEFGETGNAAYLYDEADLPFDLSKKGLYLTSLKNKSVGVALRHKNDGWEESFSEALAEHGVYPDDNVMQPKGRRQGQRGNRQEVHVHPPDLKLQVKRFCNERGLQLDDRAPSGRLVIWADASNRTVTEKLEQWGFTYERDSRRWVKAKSR